MRLPDQIRKFEILTERGNSILIQTSIDNSEIVQDRNYFLFDQSGNLIWQVEQAPPEPNPYHQIVDPYHTRVLNEAGKLIIETSGGFQYEIDWNTGKIISAVGLRRFV